MKRIILVALICIIANTAFAQASLTVGYDGNGFIYNGIRARYAHDHLKRQLAAYASISTRGFLKVDEWGSPGVTGIAGVSLNTIPGVADGVNLYYGLSAEVLVHDYAARNTGEHFTDYAALAGPQVGLVAHITSRLAFNAECGLRLGVMHGHDYKLIIPVNIPTGGYYVQETFFMAYMPTTIGLTFSLGGKTNSKETTE